MRKEISIPLLEELHRYYHPADASVAVTASGLAQAATLSGENNADNVAALSAATFAWAAKLACGSVEQVFLKAGGDCILLNSAENGADLTVVVRSCAKCGEGQAIPHCINSIFDCSPY